MRYAIAMLLILGVVGGYAGPATAQGADIPTPSSVVAQGDESAAALGIVAQAVKVGGPPGEETPYVGGRGLITEELATGMFINPTSGTLARNQFDLEYCALIFKPRPDSQTAVGHGAIANYGVTDWLEIGAAGLLADIPGSGNDLEVGGPTARVRFLKDEQWWPELSVGGVFLFGDEALEKNTVYVAASKGVALSPTGLFRSTRAHVGFRQGFVDIRDDESFVYVGGEVELPKHVFVVAEVSNKDGVATKVPWAAGIQVRHPDGFGFTLAAVQTQLSDKVAVYVGVGINF